MALYKRMSLFVAFMGLIFVVYAQDSTTKEENLESFTMIDQKTIEGQEHKIQLFMYENCMYCTRVLDFLKQYNLMDKVVLVSADKAENRALLRSISGRTQAPYLVDTDAGISMPESLDIILYLGKKFSATMASVENAITVAEPEEVCLDKKYTSSTFLPYVQASKKPVVILISTTWCPPCKIFKPIFLEVAQQYADVCEFICIDGDEYTAIVNQLGVQAYPSIVCYKNGKQINPKNYRSQEGLIKLIQQLLVH